METSSILKSKFIDLKMVAISFAGESCLAFAIVILTFILRFASLQNVSLCFFDVEVFCSFYHRASGTSEGNANYFINF